MTLRIRHAITKVVIPTHYSFIVLFIDFNIMSNKNPFVPIIDIFSKMFGWVIHFCCMLHIAGLLKKNKQLHVRRMIQNNVLLNVCCSFYTAQSNAYKIRK